MAAAACGPADGQEHERTAPASSLLSTALAHLALQLAGVGLCGHAHTGVPSAAMYLVLAAARASATPPTPLRNQERTVAAAARGPLPFPTPSRRTCDDAPDGGGDEHVARHGEDVLGRDGHALAKVHQLLAAGNVRPERRESTHARASDCARAPHPRHPRSRSCSRSPVAVSKRCRVRRAGQLVRGGAARPCEKAPPFPPPCAGGRAHMRAPERLDVQPLVVVDGARHVAHRHHLAAHLGQYVRRPRTHVAKALRRSERRATLSFTPWAPPACRLGRTQLWCELSLPSWGSGGSRGKRVALPLSPTSPSWLHGPPQPRIHFSPGCRARAPLQARCPRRWCLASPRPSSPSNPHSPHAPG